MNDQPEYRTILGIRFFAGDAHDAVEQGMRGGLVVVPSAPVLINMVEEAVTREALLHSDLAIMDSGLMVLMWNFLEHDRVRRVSGLEYLKLLLEEPELRKPGAIFWIMPTEKSLNRNLGWLQTSGYPVTQDDCYIAPLYGKGAIVDPTLLEIIVARQPRHIIIAIGGGVQERLGYYLQENTSYRPAIHCVGAAIGFLSGDQVNIPTWADRWMLGWFFRCLSAPGKFIPRYVKALRLISLMWKNRKDLPPLRQ
jgi:N-acetylglucosaminyldiphosphoundecaprenol N-acetyl-beta-D-mannosaminyltransferase